MSSFIVSGGSLFELKCPAAMNREIAQAPEFTSTLGGRRFATVRPGGRRSWSVEVSTATPAEVSTLDAVARLGRAVGWYGPDAVIGNLLSPRASGFDPVPFGHIDAGLVQLPDGVTARSVAPTSGGVVDVGGTGVAGTYEGVPVRAGSPVTLGAWGRAGVQVSGRFYDASGAQISESAWSVGVGAGWVWHEVTLTAPAGASRASIRLQGGASYALPSIAWGTVGKPETGTGCVSALVHSPSFTPRALWAGTNLTDSNFEVTELG